MMRGRMMRRRRIRSREDERRMMETAWRVKEGWIERWMNMMMTRRIGRRRRRRRAGRRRMRHESATYLIIQIRLVHCDETCVGGGVFSILVIVSFSRVSTLKFWVYL